MSDNAKKTPSPTQPIKNGPAAEAPVPVLLSWLKTYGLSAGIGAGIVLVIIVSAAAYRSQQKKSYEVAYRQLMAAKSIQAIEQVLMQYPSAPSAPDAYLKLANERFHAGSFQEAMSDYDTFIAKYKDHPNRITAEMGRLMCLEAAGRLSEALEGLVAFTNSHAAQLYMIPQAVFAKARCLQAMDRLDEARAVYEDFTLANTNSAWTPQAEASIALLDRLIREGKTAKKDVPISLQAPALPNAPPAILATPDAPPAPSPAPAPAPAPSPAPKPAPAPEPSPAP